jgi:hypothetical protein
MRVETICNEGVSLLICPETPMEEEILKALAKQENDLTQVRSTVVILNKSFGNGLLISKKNIGKNEGDGNTTEEKKV